MTDQEKITELEKNYAVMDNKIQNISDVVFQIRDNHLVHLALDIKDLSKVIEDKFRFIDQKLQSLVITDARQEPGNKLMGKVIEYVIIGVVGAGLALIIKQAYGG